MVSYPIKKRIQKWNDKIKINNSVCLLSRDKNSAADSGVPVKSRFLRIAM